MSLPFVNTEPVRLAAAVRALLVVLVTFGVGLAGPQIAAITVAVEVITALFVRKRVTPEGHVESPETPEEAFDLLTEGMETDTLSLEEFLSSLEEDES